MRREYLWLIGAAVLHTSIPLAAMVAPPPKLTGRARGPLETIDVEVEAPPPRTVDERPKALAEVDRDLTDRERLPEVARERSEWDPRENTARPRPVERPGPETPGPVPTNGPPRDEYDPLPGDQSGVITVPGIGGQPVWALPGVLPDAPAPAPAPTTIAPGRPVPSDIAGQVLRQAAGERDKALGLDLPAAGTVSTSVRDAVYASDLPTAVRGTIEVRLGPNGQVLGVHVVSMSGGSSEQWERAAKEAAARLQGRALAMGDSFEKGASVFVDVSSTMELPSGKSKSWSTFDLTNVGAHARQVVRTSFRVVPIP